MNPPRFLFLSCALDELWRENKRSVNKLSRLRYRNKSLSSRIRLMRKIYCSFWLICMRIRLGTYIKFNVWTGFIPPFPIKELKHSFNTSLDSLFYALTFNILTFRKRNKNRLRQQTRSARFERPYESQNLPHRLHRNHEFSAMVPAFWNLACY